MAFKSWSQWGRERKERSRLRDFENEKREALEDREVSNVFIIINEWTGVANNTSSEVVGSKYFESESDAWDALLLIAEAHDATLHADETSLVLKSSYLDEEYYIQELTKGDA